MLSIYKDSGFFSSDYNSNTIILERLSEIDITHHLPDDKVNNELSIVVELCDFIANRQSDLEIDFCKLIDILNAK